MPTDHKRQARPFQRQVLKLLQEQRNVILQAPTGAGKTDAALLPFVQCLEQNGDWLPRTCLYAIPMRILADQFYNTFRERLIRIDRAKGTRLTEIYEKLKREPVSIQTGEQPHDPQFESLLTFCTIDQLLASFLAVPYSVDGGRLNLNVGAIIGSYLVLDEFHLYPLLREEEGILGARTTVLTMLRLLQPVTRFVLMTATFSTTLVKELATMLNAEVVTVNDDKELNLIADGRERTFEIAPTPMSADCILSQHRPGSCSLVICNTVLRAQQQYWELKERAHERGIQTILLHSRLTDTDRAQRSSAIIHELGQAPKAWENAERYGWKDGHYYGKNLIVVATQVVEVGLDISVETLHTEIAPANSLIQRAGRCARFAKQKGRVIVYELPEVDTEGHPVTPLPYNKTACEKTLVALRTFDAQQPLGFREEQALIDAVHTEEDRDVLARYQQQNRIEKDIFQSLCTNDRSVVSSLIRDVAQVQILIHDQPNEFITEEPWRWQSFSLHPASLASRWQALEERAAQLGLPWVCREAVLVPEKTGPEKTEPERDSWQKAHYTWDIVSSSGDTGALAKKLAQSLMIVLPTQLATYHDELGFVLLDGRLSIASTGYQSTSPQEDKPSSKDEDTNRQRRKYTAIKVESYHQHISGLMKAYSYQHGGIYANMGYVISKLEELMDLPKGAIDHAIRLAIACHDLGKLSTTWQQWAWEWEKLLVKEGYALTPLPSPPFFYAKTEFDYSKEQKQLQRDMRSQRPNHACESVMLGMDLIAESLGVESPDSKLLPLLRAVCGAIARHHTPQGHEYGDVVLAQNAEKVIRDALEEVKRNANWQYDLSLVETKPIKRGTLAPENADAFVTIPKLGEAHELEAWLYFVIVRALRLADQRAGIRW